MNIDIIESEYLDEGTAKVYPWKGRPFNYSSLMVDGKSIMFFSGLTKSGKIRCEAVEDITGGKSITKYRKDKGTLELDLIYWFFGLNSVKKELVSWGIKKS
jgi:hypothetical protein